MNLYKLHILLFTYELI